MHLDDAHANDPRPTSLARRDVLRGLGIAGLGTAVGCMSMGTGEAAARAQVLQSSCTLTPSSIQGPFWLNLSLLRKELHEGLPGIPLTMWIRVVDSDCAPIDGAVVDVWHNESQGVYSGFANQGTAGETWNRGIQVTGTDGLVCFQTIYPGWYPGRTTHVHLKINPTLNSELTTQLYFPDEVTDRLYAFPPYDVHGPKNTTNAQDNWYLPETEMGTIVTPNLGGTWVRAYCGTTIVID